MRHLQLRARAGVLYPLAVCGRQRRGLLRAGGGDHGAGEADAAQSGARDARAPPHARAGDLLIHATPLLLMHATPLLLMHATPLLLTAKVRVSCPADRTLRGHSAGAQLGADRVGP